MVCMFCEVVFGKLFGNIFGIDKKNPTALWEWILGERTTHGVAEEGGG